MALRYRFLNRVLDRLELDFNPADVRVERSGNCNSASWQLHGRTVGTEKEDKGLCKVAELRRLSIIRLKMFIRRVVFQNTSALRASWLRVYGFHDAQC